EWPPRRRPLPQVVVEALGRRRLLAAADRLPVVLVPGLGEVGPADDALADLVDGLDDLGPAAPLAAHLDVLAVLAGGLHHQLALARVVAARLLDVDVLAGGAGEDARRRVPLVAGRD